MSKELGQRTDEELEQLFGKMYDGWDRGVVITQERFGDGETRFAERTMTELELAARFVAAEIGINIYEIAGRAAFAPIITFSQIQARIGPIFDREIAKARRQERERCAKAVGEMRQLEAGLFDAAHSGQRGCDRSDALYDAYRVINALPEAVVAEEMARP